MEITGTIIVLNNTEKISDSFSKREIVIATSEQYSQKILVQFVKDKCEVLNNYKVGDEVKVSYNLLGKEWTNPQGETKYFNTIQGWRIEKENQQSNSNQMPPIPSSEAFAPATDYNEEEHDDLPF